MPLSATITINPAGTPAYIAALSPFQRIAHSTVANGKVSFTSALPAGVRAYNPPQGGNKIAYAFGSGWGREAKRRYGASGGGHMDDWINHMCEFNLLGTTMPTGWEYVTGSGTSPGQEGFNVETYPDGRPASSHTYDGQNYYAALNMWFRFGGFMWGSSAPISTRAWTFDFTNFDTGGSGAYRASVSGSLGGGSPVTDDSAPTVVVNQNTGNALIWGEGGRYRTYNFASNTLSSPGQISNAQETMTSAYAWWNSGTKVLMAHPGGYRQFNWDGSFNANITVSVPTFTGGSPPSSDGNMMFEDQAGNAIWMLDGGNPGTLHKFVPGAGAAWTYSANSISGPSSNNGLQNNRNFKRGVVIGAWRSLHYSTDENGATHTIRLP